MADFDDGGPNPDVGSMYPGQVTRPQLEGPTNLGLKLGVRVAAFRVVEQQVEE